MIERTSEFDGAVRVLRGRGALPAPLPDPPDVSPFMSAAERVALGFEGTGRLVERLKSLVARKGFSNDPTAEIEDVSRLFKGDLQVLQREIAALRRHADEERGQRRKHCTCVVDTLQKTAVAHTKAFQAALMQRTSVLKSQNQRRKHFSHSKGVAPQVPQFQLSQPVPLFGAPIAAAFSAPNSSGASASTMNPATAANGINGHGTATAGGSPAPASTGSFPHAAALHLQPTPSPPRSAQAAAVPSSNGAINGRFEQVQASAAPPMGQLGLGATAGIGSSALPSVTAPPPKPAYGVSSVPNSFGGATGPGKRGSGLRRRQGAVKALVGGTSGSHVQVQASQWQVQEMERSSTNRLEGAQHLETMIGELGQMFSKFTNLVAQQEETVMHIEDDVEMAHGFAE
ncbi:unnamed protein product, partial [Chrysoparadoxa australica]